MTIVNSNEQEIKLYELALLIREDNFFCKGGKLVLFYAGDIMDHEIKRK